MSASDDRTMLSRRSLVQRMVLAAGLVPGWHPGGVRCSGGSGYRLHRGARSAGTAGREADGAAQARGHPAAIRRWGVGRRDSTRPVHPQPRGDTRPLLHLNRRRQPPVLAGWNRRVREEESEDPGPDRAHPVRRAILGQADRRVRGRHSAGRHLRSAARRPAHRQSGHAPRPHASTSATTRSTSTTSARRPSGPTCGLARSGASPPGWTPATRSTTRRCSRKPDFPEPAADLGCPGVHHRQVPRVLPEADEPLEANLGLRL